jgi:hypothetical protein
MALITEYPLQVPDTAFMNLDEESNPSMFTDVIMKNHGGRLRNGFTLIYLKDFILKLF